MKLLIVEDNEDLTNNLTEIFELEGFEVTSAVNGAEGLICAADGFDLAIVDVRLPDGSGTALVPQLKAHAEHAEVIMATANADLDSAIAAVQAGAFAYLTKPVRVEDLLVTVARARERVELRRTSARLQNALEASELRMRTLVESVHAVILTVGEDFRVRFANRTSRGILGWEPRELRYQDTASTLAHPRHKDRFQRLLEDALEGRSAVDELDCKHWDGTVRRIFWRWTVGTEGEDRVLHGVGTDVTQQRELERRTIVSEKLATAGTLTAGLAHEIRNPLNAAGLQLSVLARSLKRLPAEEVDALRQPLDVVRSELKRLDALLEDFLAFARPKKVRRVDIDLSEIIAGVARLEGERARAAGCELSTELAPATVEGDPDLLRQLLINLVNNAIEAAASQIVITTEVQSTTATIAVEDDGPGVPAEVKERILEPFYTTKPNGTGLGMAIAHNIVTRHHGQLEIDESPSGGARILITLPGGTLS